MLWENMKEKNEKKWGCYDYYFFILVLFLFISYLINSKFIFEGVSILVCFFMLTLVGKLSFIFLYLLFSFVNVESYLANIVIIYYIVSLEFVLGRIKCIGGISFNVFLIAIVSVVIGISLFEVMQGAYRPSSIFSGPLALGYFLVSCSIILMVNNPRFGYVFFVLPLLSGSRSSTLLLLPFLKYKGIKKLIKFTPFLFIPLLYIGWDYIDLLTRSLTFNSTSDGGRFDSYSHFFSLDWSLLSYLFGFGRVDFGSLGFALGNSQSIIIESSLLSLIASYGFIFGFLWCAIFLCGVFVKKSMIWLLFFLVSCLSVFHDSLGVILFVLMGFSYGEQHFNRLRLKL